MLTGWRFWPLTPHLTVSGLLGKKFIPCNVRTQICDVCMIQASQKQDGKNLNDQVITWYEYEWWTVLSWRWMQTFPMCLRLSGGCQDPSRRSSSDPKATFPFDSRLRIRIMTVTAINEQKSVQNRDRPSGCDVIKQQTWRAPQTLERDIRSTFHRTLLPLITLRFLHLRHGCRDNLWHNITILIKKEN